MPDTETFRRILESPGASADSVLELMRREERRKAVHRDGELPQRFGGAVGQLGHSPGPGMIDRLHGRGNGDRTEP